MLRPVESKSGGFMAIVQRNFIAQKFFSLADLMILMVIATAIYGLVAIGNEWRSDFHPLTIISLSPWALPKYVLLSATRGIVAYLISLSFTIVVGYSAAKSARAEKLILPMLDILQSIPVLGFLPGLVLGLIALFPHTNMGLELAAVLMIFTGQVWNMTFSFYSSLKSVPSEFQEASTVIGLTWWQKLMWVEMPYSAVNLAWNSLMSMAGGWFFLSVCEAFTLGNREYRLPGIGSYMATAITAGDTGAMLLGVFAMVLLIVVMDFVIWRPIMAWVQRFRLEEIVGAAAEEPLMGVFIRESRILRWVKLLYRRYSFRYRKPQMQTQSPAEVEPEEEMDEGTRKAIRSGSVKRILRALRRSPQVLKVIDSALRLAVVVLVYWSVYGLLKILVTVEWTEWVFLLRNTLWTLIRVMVALFFSTLWAVPVGIWIGTSPRRIRVAQPIIQVLASFPAPMLYPLALTALFKFKVGFDWASMVLMLLGVQWYVLFNVLAGALRIPQELGYALSLMHASRWDRWRRLLLPSVFPSLVTGWVTAAGGAWNASIVAEYVSYHGQTLQTGGLGATISVAAANQDFHVLAASLSIMVLVVILLNRGVWGRIYRMAQTRYRMDL